MNGSYAPCLQVQILFFTPQLLYTVRTQTVILNTLKDTVRTKPLAKRRYCTPWVCVPLSLSLPLSFSLPLKLSLRSSSIDNLHHSIKDENRCVHLSVCLYICLYVCTSVCLSVCTSVCTSVYLSIYLSIFFSIFFLFNRFLSIFLSVCLPACLSVLY